MNALARERRCKKASESLVCVRERKGYEVNEMLQACASDKKDDKMSEEWSEGGGEREYDDYGKPRVAPLKIEVDAYMSATDERFMRGRRPKERGKVAEKERKGRVNAAMRIVIKKRGRATDGEKICTHVCD